MEANWLGGIIGGGLIGLSAVLLLLFNGRIAGISGIVGNLVSNMPSRDVLWRMMFIVGLLLGAGIYVAIQGHLVIQMQASRSMLIVAGLLIGVGSRLGSGCTSGHGVCGIARLSKRSIVATLVFISIAMLVVFVMNRIGI
jgi:uncharacterized membrane protein YedE/YeeE